MELFSCHLLHGKGEVMKKSLVALAAAAALAGSAAVAVPGPAYAQRGVAAGGAAGVIGGAIVGGARASQTYYSGRGSYSGPGSCPSYYGGAPAYVADPGGPC